MSEALEDLLPPLLRTASTMRLAPASELQVTDSKFGGSPYFEAGEEWPVCPTCRRHLSFICQVDLRATVHHIPYLDFFTFFYCWECSPWGFDREAPGEWVVRRYMAPAERRAVLLPIPDDPPKTSPCKITFHDSKSLPDWEGKTKWCPRATDAARRINEDEPWQAYREEVEGLVGAETDYRSQIGGYPHWVQSESTPAGMDLMAQIDSEDAANVMWGDVGCIYLFISNHNPGNVKLILQCH